MPPGVTTVLGGVSDIAHLEEVAAASDAGPLTAEDLRQIEAVWRA
jgi:aryl-alcohol dehydrogenase-like predicted oxidoreductase